MSWRTTPSIDKQPLNQKEAYMNKNNIYTAKNQERKRKKRKPKLIEVLNTNKRDTLKVSASAKRSGLPPRVYIPMDNCGTYIDKYQLKGEKSFHIHKANFCKGRLCPMCIARKSDKEFARLIKSIQYIDHTYTEEKFKYIFLTLSSMNYTPEKLNNGISDYIKAWRRLMNNDSMTRRFPGWYRAIELTYNDKDNTWNLHIHAILIARSDYYKKVNGEYTKNYLTQEQLMKKWGKALETDPQDTTVYIQAVKTVGNKKIKAIAEVSKYATKSSDYIKEDNPGLMDELIYSLYYAVRKRQFIAYGGILKAAEKTLRDVKGEKVNLDELKEDIDYIMYRLRWRVGISTFYKNKTRVNDANREMFSKASEVFGVVPELA